MEQGRTKAVVYNELLRWQVDLSFDLEQLFFRAAGAAWRDANLVLDFGAGNGYYSMLLSQRNPGKRFCCVERDPERAKIATENVNGYPISMVTGSFQDVSTDQPYGLVLARHTISYLTPEERVEFADWAMRSTSHNAAIIVIDAVDTSFSVYPRMPLLEGGIDEFKDKLDAEGGNREDLCKSLGTYFEPHGFIPSSTQYLTVHSDIAMRKPLLGLFMLAIAEYDHGTPIPAPVRQEIEDWVRNPDSYLQYGMFGTVLSKKP